MRKTGSKSGIVITVPADTAAQPRRHFQHRDTFIVCLCLMVFMVITWLYFVHRAFLNSYLEPTDAAALKLTSQSTAG